MIKEVENKDLAQAIDLVNDVFSEFVAVDYSEQGRKSLENKLKEISDNLKSKDKKMWAYYHDDKIIGVIAVENTSHISLMFVDKWHHKKGIARQLFQVVLKELKEVENVKQVTVNSSPYAVEIYKRLGFVQTGKQQEKEGIIFMMLDMKTYQRNHS